MNKRNQWKRISVLILALSLLLPFAAPAFAQAAGPETAGSEVKLLCLNIGKADCFLLFSGDTRWLVDAGYEQNYPALEAALKEYQVDRLDGVFLTHCHEDHEGGLLPLAKSDTPVSAWYAAKIFYDVKDGEHPAVLAAKERGEAVTWLSAGDVIQAGADAAFTVLGPLEVNEKNENDNSLVLRFDSPAGSILFCGDMKTAEEEDLLSAGTLTPCTLLKAGHHGDGGTLKDRFLKAVRPQAAVISTSAAEEADTPAESTLLKLKNAACETFVTQDFHDALLLTLSGGKVTGADDVAWTGVPPRIEGITLEIDAGEDTVTLTNTAGNVVSLDGYLLFSTKGDERLPLSGLTLEPGGTWTVGGKKTKVPVDQTWDEKSVWSKKKRDVGVLYDPWGRPVASADNGVSEK